MGTSINEKSTRLVSAFYPTEQAARYALSRLEEEGLGGEQMYLVGNPAPSLKGIPAASATDVSAVDDILTVVRDDLLQAGAGAEPGLADAAGVSALNVRVFVATPVLQTLLALGHEPTIGPAEESPKIVDVSEDQFSELVRDAVENEHWAVVLRPEHNRISQKALDLLSMLFD